MIYFHCDYVEGGHPKNSGKNGTDQHGTASGLQHRPLL